jgi:hypothetical protein
MITTLPSELLTLIVFELDRHSVSALMLTCKVIHERLSDIDLLSVIARKKGVILPPQLLVIYDYSLIKPSEFIPVFIQGEKKILRLDNDLEQIVASYFPPYTSLWVKVEVIESQQTKYVWFKCEKYNYGDLQLSQDDTFQFHIGIEDSLGNMTNINPNIEEIENIEEEHHIRGWLDVVLEYSYYIVNIRVNPIRK